MNFNIFSKKEEAATPTESTVTLTVHLTDGAQISAVDKVYSLDEYDLRKNLAKLLKKFTMILKMANL